LGGYSGQRCLLFASPWPVNKGSAAADVPITIAGGTAPASCTPNVTSASDNLAAKSAVTASGGTLTAALASKTVTTFVCK
jgi:hypothetical protein